MLKNTLVFLSLLSSFSDLIKFENQIIHINPITWDELQLMQLSHLKSSEELSLSNTCPDYIQGYKELDIKGSFFKEILWTQYFWTQFQNSDGKLCLIKHNTFNLFTEAFGPEKDDGSYEILSETQASVLLSAAESLGFDEEGVEILMRNVGYHNSAVAEKQYAVYGGRNRMQSFLESNPPEKTPIPYTEGVTFLQRFESNYTRQTLKRFKDEVKKNPTKDRFNGKYPFNSLEALLDEVQTQIKLKEEYKKRKSK